MEVKGEIYRVAGPGHAAQLQVGAGGEVDDAIAVGLG